MASWLGLLSISGWLARVGESEESRGNSRRPYGGGAIHQDPSVKFTQLEVKSLVESWILIFWYPQFQVKSLIESWIWTSYLYYNFLPFETCTWQISLTTFSDGANTHIFFRHSTLQRQGPWAIF